MKMNFAIIYDNGDIYRVFKTLEMAKLYYEYQEYEEPTGFKIIETNKSLTDFPQNSYYANWNK